MRGSVRCQDDLDSALIFKSIDVWNEIYRTYVVFNILDFKFKSQMKTWNVKY